MRSSRGMGCIRPELMEPKGYTKGGVTGSRGGESRVNEAGNYTTPGTTGRQARLAQTLKGLKK